MSKTITIISKKECNRCEEAIYFCELHNITFQVEKLQTKYEILKKYQEHEDEIMSISMYPFVFIPDQQLMVDFEYMKSTMGERLLLPNNDRYVLFPIQYPEFWKPIFLPVRALGLVQSQDKLQAIRVVKS